MAIRERQWACSGKETDSELCEAEASCRFWKRGNSPLPGAFLLRCFVKEKAATAMLCLCASVQRKLWHLASVAEKAGLRGGRRAEILIVEKGIEASRVMNLAVDSFLA